MTDQPTEQQLDEITARKDAATPGSWGIYEYGTDGSVTDITAEVRRLRADLERRTEDVAFLERTTLPELRREIEHHKDGKQRWRGRAEKAETRVTELEGPAVEARAALASLCYDLEDPGSAALGALYLISRVTVDVDAPRDEAAQVMASHDAQIMRRCAEFVRDSYDGEWVADAAATLERDADITERGCPGYEDAGRGDTVAERQLANCKHCGRPRAVCVAAPTPTPAPLDASHSPAGDRDGETGTEGAAGRVGDSGAELGTATTDTLPAWLHQRYAVNGPTSWERLDDGQRAYWEHQARAVRRAVDRGGFKDGAASPTEEAAR